MKEYVAGFMFTENRRYVVLIQKNRPKWQFGKLNGVGGHIEEGETPLQAMVREFHEETGVRHEAWRHFSELRGNDFVVHFFLAVSSFAYRVESLTDEPVDLWSVGHLPSNIVPNLAWLIPMALSFEVGETAKGFTVTETTTQQNEVCV